MIIKALRDFLLSTDPLADSVRDAGRVDFQNLVRWRVTDGRIPKSKGGNIAVTVRHVSEIQHGAVNGPVPLLSVIVEISIWAKDTDERSGAEAAREAYAGLRLMLAQYAGPLNDDISVQTIKHESGPHEQVRPAVDASGGWTYRYTSTYLMGVPTTMPAGAN